MHGEVWLRDVRPPSDSKIRLKKPAAGFPGAGFTIFAMMKICR
jgi:hypothetical protein